MDTEAAYPRKSAALDKDEEALSLWTILLQRHVVVAVESIGGRIKAIIIVFGRHGHQGWWTARHRLRIVGTEENGVCPP